MSDPSAIDILLRVAREAEGASEVPPNTNSGPFVERVLAGVGLKKGDPWCAAWVYDVGRKALGDRWPLPKTGGCAILGEFATAKNILHDIPNVGDVFLIYHAPLKRFGHTGFIVGPGNDTLSGNTSGAGSREGWMVGRRVWTFGPRDRFVRWVDLL